MIRETFSNRSLRSAAGHGMRFREERRDDIGESQTLRFFAVDHRDFFNVTREFVHVGLQFVAIRVARERVDGGDTRAHLVRLPENVHGISARENLRAQGVLSAVADEEDEIFRVADVV